MSSPGSGCSIGCGVREITKGGKVDQTTDPGKKTVASAAYDGNEAIITFSDTGYAGTITWKPGEKRKRHRDLLKKNSDDFQVIGKRNEVSMTKIR